jgi:hypothetical protein
VTVPTSRTFWVGANLYSVGDRLGSRLHHWLASLRCFVVFISLSSQISAYYLIRPWSLPSRCLTIHHSSNIVTSNVLYTRYQKLPTNPAIPDCLLFISRGEYAKNTVAWSQFRLVPRPQVGHRFFISSIVGCSPKHYSPAAAPGFACMLPCSDGSM